MPVTGGRVTAADLLWTSRRVQQALQQQTHLQWYSMVHRGVWQEEQLHCIAPEAHSQQRPHLHAARLSVSRYAGKVCTRVQRLALRAACSWQLSLTRSSQGTACSAQGK